MRALVTGASGFVGRHVVRLLLHRGIDVVALGRRATGLRSEVRVIEVDLLNNDGVEEAVASARAELLIHLAWYTEHGVFWNSPINHEWVGASVRLVEGFCRSGGARVVGVGTAAEYEWLQECCREDSTPLRPATVYGAAKDAARRAVALTCGAYAVPCVWARVFIPFGLGESPRRLIPSVIQTLRGISEPFAIDGTAARDFMHVSDVAAGLVAVACSDATDTVNVCAGMPTRIGEMVTHLAFRLGADPQPLERLYARRSGEPQMLYGANDRARGLGWGPTLSVREGLDLVLSAATG